MRLTVLNQGDIQAIHDAALRILAGTGIALSGDEARALLLDFGASERDGRTCLPPTLVEGCLARCPPQVTLRGRGGGLAVLGDGTLHVHNMGGARDVLDVPGGNLRPASRRDVAESARLLDALTGVTTVTPLYTPQDVPAPALAAVMLAETVRHTLKPINGPGVQTAREVRLLAEMARVVFGDAGVMSLGVSPVSPLTFPAGISGAILETARQGMPIGPLPCPQVGVSAPMSLAGALAQQHAEVLAAIVLAQLAAPGLPVIYCGRLATVNMRTALPNWGIPEIGLISAAMVQIAHRCRLPVNVYGLAGSGFAIDIQSGYERALNAALPALAGADELSGVGEMAGGVCSSNVQMVIDNEIVGMVRRVRSGLAVNEDTLALDVIARVMGLSARTFLAEPHTVQHLRAGEVWQARLGVQGVDWVTWRADGCETIVERAQAEAARILREHEVPPLSEEQGRALDELIRSAQEN